MLPGCSLVLFRADDAAVLEPPHLPAAVHHQRSRFRLADPKSMPLEARSARISKAESPAPLHLCTVQSFGPGRRHMFFPDTEGTAAARLLSGPIPAEAARKPRK